MQRPSVPALTEHDIACREGREWYIDPLSGLLVFTEIKLIQNGNCCGSGCRHCPYEPRAQKDGTALRAGIQSKA
jgi:hypothetical protein